MNLAQYLLENTTQSAGTFIAGPDQTITYSELHKRINAVSFFLENRFEKGWRIGLFSDNSEFFVIAYLSILKAGCVAVMLDCNASKDKIEDELTRTSVGSVFAKATYAVKLEDYEIDVFDENDLRSICAVEIPVGYENIYRGVGDDLAVIFFTSGTMAKRKGVMLSHKNIIANTSSIISYLEITEDDISCLVLPLYYAGGTAVLHTHMRMGASIVLFSTMFPGTIIEYLRKFNCTNISGVPTTFSILLRRGDFTEYRYPSLRFLAQAGGAMADSMITQLNDSFPDVDLFVMYGQTEASARLSYLPPDKIATKLGSIGKGIPGVELRIVDADMNILGPGQYGELIARGDNIMLGYLDDIEATNRVIRDGWLHTFDLATQDEDGFIFVRGRMDDVIKSAGHRVSPEEIENIVLAHPDVTQCGAVSIKDSFLGEAIVLFVETQERESLMQQKLTRYCIDNMSSHMRPKHFVIMETLPLNSSLKLDRALLRKLAKQAFPA